MSTLVTLIAWIAAQTTTATTINATHWWKTSRLPTVPEIVGQSTASPPSAAHSSGTATTTPDRPHQMYPHRS